VRVLCHAQHLTGVGHFVIAHNIARGLAVAHEVHLVDGGRPVPRPASAFEPKRLPLPIMRRAADGRLLVEGGGPAEPVLARRAELLAEAAREIRPDVVLVDHFPFSKWELQPEIIAAIEESRSSNPNVRVLSSLRDIAPRTRYENVTDEEHADRVLALLAEGFDGLLVHTDPEFTRLAEHFPGADAVPVPIAYTGFVGEPASVPLQFEVPWSVLSGGGSESTAFLVAAMTAFGNVARSGALGPMRLQVFAPLEPSVDDRAALERAAYGAPIDVHSFSTEFGAWLCGAAVSISRAGYNTVAALLALGVRAVVVPGPRLSDQRPRAERLAQAGLAVTVDAALESDVDALAAAITAALASPQPRHSFDLTGVATTRRLVEESLDGEESWVSGVAGPGPSG
jgi:predicted glycosyltransferase